MIRGATEPVHRMKSKKANLRGRQQQAKVFVIWLVFGRFPSQYNVTFHMVRCELRTLELYITRHHGWHNDGKAHKWVHSEKDTDGVKFWAIHHLFCYTYLFFGALGLLSMDMNVLHASLAALVVDI